MATPDRWELPGWWPTKGTAPLSEYAGPDPCNDCHGSIGASQRLTPMFNAARLASAMNISPSGLEFHDDTYSYSFSPASNTFTVTDKEKTSTISGTVGWVFGAPGHSQTYLIQRNGALLESRLSYFTQLPGLDITPGHSPSAPPGIEQALGTRVDAETIRRCFGCHSTASTAAGKFDPQHALMGVTCEACHGPGARHAAAMQAEGPRPGSSKILNPRRLSPMDSVDFCGACHRTPADAGLIPGNLGLTIVRFQPYRLEKSHCWGAAGDRRITCVACHDPHKPLQHDLTSYDEQCLSCHSVKNAPHTAAQSARPCKAASRGCVSCHMPKVKIEWAHEVFTDHYIRIVERK